MALYKTENDTFYFTHFIDDIGRLRFWAVISFKISGKYFTKEQKLFMEDNLTSENLNESYQKVKWHRLKHSFKQSKIAECLGVSTMTYMRFEQGIEIVLSSRQYDSLADLFGVQVGDLLDEYNGFLYCGQGSLIKKYRKEHHLTQQKFAEVLSVSASQVKRWESGKARLSKARWLKLFST